MSGATHPSAGALAGIAIAVTRPAQQAGPLIAALKARGAIVHGCPLIRIEAPADPEALRAAAARAGGYDWIVFTSANAVDRFGAALAESGGRLRDGVRIAAVGPATAASTAAIGLPPAFVPGVATGAALAAALETADSWPGRRVLFPRARDAARDIVTALAARGARVDEVECYRTISDAGGARRLADLLARGALDAIVLSSPSQVAALGEHVGIAAAGGVAIAALGPVTAAAARRRGLDVHIEPAGPAIDQLIDALSSWFAARRGGPPTP
jgi:uroporphyrinogen-III synthase